MTDQSRPDVVVVGAGPAGIAAATVAAEAGASVTLLDSGIRPGGQIWRHSVGGHLPRVAHRWLRRLVASGASFIPRATVVDAVDRTLLVEVGGAPQVVRAPTLVIATGARELFLPFPGWTLPNVMGLGGAQALIKSGASFAGKRVAVAGSGPLVLAVAALLASKGARLAIVAEQASARAVWSFAAGLWRTPGKFAEAARYRGAFATTAYRTGVWTVEAHGIDRVRDVVVSDGRKSWSVECDVLCASYGLVPNIELARLIGCDIVDGAVAVDSSQRTSMTGVLCAGEPTGIAGADSAIAQGVVAGMVATGRAVRDPHPSSRSASLLAHAFAPRAELRDRVSSDTIICRCEDVSAGAVATCGSSREAKLLTRAGMGPCQGRICGPALAFLHGWSPDTPRPPIFPTTVDTLACAEQLVSLHTDRTSNAAD